MAVLSSALLMLLKEKLPVGTGFAKSAWRSLAQGDLEGLRRCSSRETGRAISGCGRANAFECSERDPVSMQLHQSELKSAADLAAPTMGKSAERKWYAVFTFPQNEKSAVKHLALRDVESFLPTYETVRVWKNRQRIRTVLPLFPSYLFVHIEGRQRSRVLESPGVIHIVGNSREHVPVPDAAIELLRSGVQSRNVEPYHELVVGRKVRIKRGSMEGVQGVLVRKGNGMRFVLAIDMINQYAAIEVGAEDLEQIAE